MSAPPVADHGKVAGFDVRLENFEGPFDLLLQLITKHRLDVTEVALSQVTDDFIAHIKAMGDNFDLDVATEFLVVAATLLDLKAARLLPSGEVDDEGDLALLEARDILFARLLQYRAYKEIAAIFQARNAAETLRFPRAVALEAAFSGLLPEVLIGLGPDRFAALAQRILSPKVMPSVSLDHIHSPLVSVKEQALLLVERLRRVRSTTFRALSSDAPDTMTVVARFLAILELFKAGAIHFEQVSALGELSVQWVGTESGPFDLTDEFDGQITEETDGDGE
ncbi:segregation and condensation protein A [mine drainage metagenome]|uniref:Segregation and condensation protein A n=1 Tax=mine drainage metagenome TaxID=410659 RepID=A0A1J5QAD7_9ZZZZ